MRTRAPSSLTLRLTRVHRPSGITSDPAVGSYYDVGVSLAEAEAFYSDSLGGQKALTYGQFKDAIARLAARLYAEIGEMDAAERLAATIKNVLRQESAAACVAAHTYIAAPDRFNAWRDCPSLPGETKSDRLGWLSTWQRLDLSSLPGFPLWEEEVHGLLHEAFAELLGIFSHYAKS